MKKKILFGLSLFFLMLLVQISYAQTIPQTDWSLWYVDSEELIGEDGAAINAFDGDVNTFWHTEWLNSDPPLPHEIQIDLGQSYEIEGFRYLPRQDGGINGTIEEYEFYVSSDGSNWGDPVATGAFVNDTTEKEVLFPSVTGRYIRLRALTEVNGNPWTSVAEINVLGTPASGNYAPNGVIDTPTSNMTINVGEWVEFTGTGTDPDGDLPLSFLWQFGAGSGIADSTLEDPGLVQFNNPGTFTVTFTVTDALGLSDPTPAMCTVTVLDEWVEPAVPDWTHVQNNPFNLIEPEGITNPVLTAEDVMDASARYVADPFIFYEDGIWYMFFEAYLASGRGAIALATSLDGLNWNYEQIVLSEPWHLSYPLIIKSYGKYYLIPESHTQNAVYIYEATNFPYEWARVSTIVSGRPFVDPSIFRYNNRWWMFVGDTTNSNCYLYYSDNLLTGWVEHPMSPIVANDASKARPGGRSFVFDNGRIIRIAQKCDVVYGEQVRAFEIDVLTSTDYAEHEIPESPILDKAGTGWNATGMHQYDPWWTGNYWLCAVDGNNSGEWSIGIYISEDSQ